MVGAPGWDTVRRVAGSADDSTRGGSPTHLATVALIGGTGKLGSALAGHLARAGHAVVIGSREVARADQTASAVRTATGVPAALLRGADNVAAAAGADVVVITVPFDVQEATVRHLVGVIGERIVVSTAVPLRMVDGAPTHVEVEQGSASEQVAVLLPSARVIGALHTVSSAILAKLDRRLDADVLLTGDDPDAKTAVARLLASLPGVRAVDAGPLRNSRYIEQLTVLLLTINMRVRRNTGIRVTNLPDEVAMAAPPSAPPRGG
jgi:8-hydroxy-5-deazaflavin:NADPH oxidoreductase